MKKICVIHGPNLNLLGTREPEIYGSTTLDAVDAELVAKGEALGVAVESFQSNHEGAIVDKIQTLRGGYDGLIINPGAYTHTSIAIRDGLLALTCPIIEVHISNVYKREAFRHHSYLADVVTGRIVGLGVKGYGLALEGLMDDM
jgi:3-dehydroquinate dehydratase-2